MNFLRQGFPKVIVLQTDIYGTDATENIITPLGGW